jgi:hypothetical protein
VSATGARYRQSGTTFADALPAAAYLARVSGPLLLTDPNALPSTASTYLVLRLISSFTSWVGSARMSYGAVYWVGADR